MPAVVGRSEAASGEPAVVGEAGNTDNDGVIGFTGSPSRAGVLGINRSSGVGVKGTSEEHDAVQGFAKHQDHAGVVGDNQNGTGVRGQSVHHIGVHGLTEHNAGVHGFSTHGTGIVGEGGTFAAQFVGTVEVTGDLKVTGDVLLTGQDYAEALSTSETDIEAGFVVVLGDDGGIRRCERDYDTAVAGIVSGACGIKPAIVLGRHDGSADVALMGKVWCQADAEVAPIRPGDLLTTSATVGHCRRVTEPARAFGAVIGKALTPLASGRGLVRVLVGPR